MRNGLRSLPDPSSRDVAVSGGKGANLATLTQAGFPVPPGAVVVPDAYRTFVTPLASLIESMTRGLVATDHAAIARASEVIATQAEVLDAPVSMVSEIDGFVGAADASVRWAVRSSGTAEDTAAAAFAGQHDTYLNRSGTADVVAHVKRCWLSLWSPRAIAYRAQMNV